MLRDIFEIELDFHWIFPHKTSFIAWFFVVVEGHSFKTTMLTTEN